MATKAKSSARTTTKRQAPSGTKGTRGEADRLPKAWFFYYAFAIPRSNLHKLGIDRISNEAGTPPVRTGQGRWPNVSLRGVDALDKDLQSVVFVESHVYSGTDRASGLALARKFAQTKRGRQLRESAINYVLYEFDLDRGAANPRRGAR